MPNIHFKFDNFELKKIDKGALKKLGEAWKAGNDFTITIEGNTTETIKSETLVEETMHALFMFLLSIGTGKLTVKKEHEIIKKFILDLKVEGLL